MFHDICAYSDALNIGFDLYLFGLMCSNMSIPTYIDPDPCHFRLKISTIDILTMYSYVYILEHT